MGWESAGEKQHPNAGLGKGGGWTGVKFVPTRVVSWSSALCFILLFTMLHSIFNNVLKKKRNENGEEDGVSDSFLGPPYCPFDLLEGGPP